MKKMYFYFDEGGLFGDANVCISSKPLELVDSEEHISNYLFGEIPISSIRRHLRLFNKVYPKCHIKYDELSEIKDMDLSPVSC
jgi:hypothetical protein